MAHTGGIGRVSSAKVEGSVRCPMAKPTSTEGGRPCIFAFDALGHSCACTLGSK